MGSFYGHLERLGSHPNVKGLYITSAMSSHDSVYLTQIGDHMYASTVTRGGITSLSGVLSNRYFEDFCEILRLMKKIEENGKRVFYITLDSQFRVFNENSVSRTSAVPYVVPFVNSTKFVVNEPKMFRRVQLPRPTDPRGTPIRLLNGGKWKKTRKYKLKKHKKTRKV